MSLAFVSVDHVLDLTHQKGYRWALLGVHNIGEVRHESGELSTPLLLFKACAFLCSVAEGNCESGRSNICIRRATVRFCTALWTSLSDS
jgi:hypothetical protein